MDSGATTTLPDATAVDGATTVNYEDAGSALLCTSSSACADASVCCLTSAGSACQASPCGTYQLCAQSTECPSGDNCAPITGLGYSVCLSSSAEDSGSDSGADDAGDEDAGDGASLGDGAAVSDAGSDGA